ncbi:hypothetical protein JTB14_032980 [Gonioctena quinquepunctata]|nr:hypothetical protein JTB14_032980 [Gonioctena quinquepunctata]
METEEIERSIIQQNGLTESFKVTFLKKGKKGNIIFAESLADNFNKLTQAKRVYIGWESYPVFEDLSVPRCYKCQGFYHKQQECRRKLTCPQCAEEHEERDCPKQRKCCANCLNANQNYRTNHKLDHQTTDGECPILKYQTELLKNKTDYLSQWL